MTDNELWKPLQVDSDFDIRDSEGGLICLQASCASDEMMREIVHCVNNHERLVEALHVCERELARIVNGDEVSDRTMTAEMLARDLLAELEAAK